MKFDAYAVLAKLRSEGGGRAKRATCANQVDPFSTISTISTISTGQAVLPATAGEPVGNVIGWPGKGYPPEAIRQGVAEAFEDWEAMNDPHDPRAWA